MKKITGLILMIFLYASTAIAFDAQSALIGVKGESSDITANVTVAISIPAFKGIEPIIFEGEVKATVTKGEGYVLIMAKDVSPLAAELTDIPDSFKPVTVEISPVSSTIKVAKNEDGELSISDIGLGVSIFKSNKEAMSFVISDLPLTIENVSDGEANLSFTATFPTCDNELFNQVLAGKDVNGTIDIRY